MSRSDNNVSWRFPSLGYSYSHRRRSYEDFSIPDSLRASVFLRLISPKAVALILKALRSLADDGLSILLVEQLAVLALEVADHAYVLQRGKSLPPGPPQTSNAIPHWSRAI
jgi:hypothetical protein